jgi:hypothetical protein
MSRGPGRVQMACLWCIQKYEERGDDWPTTYNITAEVYQVKPDKDSNRYVTDAQHVAVKRALEGLQRQGRIIGFRTQRARSPGDGRTELCHHWMTAQRARKWVSDESANSLYMAAHAERIMKKMQAIGMDPGSENET